MGARDAALDFASKYFLIRSFDLIFVFMFVMYQAIRQAQGETLKPVVLNGIAIVINIFGTYLFVSVFELGIEGAAYATLFANIVVTPFILYDLMYSKKHLTISLKEIIPNKEVIEDTIHFALPAAFGQSMTAFGFIIIQSLVLAYGTSVSAGFGVASRITMLLLYPIVALSQVNASFIGLNIGHKQQERARQSYIITRRVSLIIMLIGVGIMIPLRGELIGFILGTKTSLSFEIGMEFGLWLLLTQPFMAIFQTFMGVFNGVGMSKYTMWLSLLRLWGMRIPLLLLYPLFIPNASYEAMYVTMMISNILIIPIGLYYESKINFDVKVRLHA
jgi:putative MATE family efflux protein